MRIAQVAPIFESVPPKLYGGTERVAYYLTEELSRLGHEVVLYASEDSHSSARLVPTRSKALRLDANGPDPFAAYVTMLEQVFQDIERQNYDIVHFHIDYWHFPVTRRARSFKHITTVHSRLDMEDARLVYNYFPEMPLASISYAQRLPLAHLNWQANVYHGLPPLNFTPNFESGKYLAFLGRVSPEKGVDRAIEIARRFGMTLKIAAKVDNANAEYFESIKHLMQDPLVEFIGEISDAEKSEFLGNAFALLFPVDWPEPFGLVMIESLACGTPVIAFHNGATPEVIEHGVTGFIVQSVDEGVAALEKIPTLDRQACRQSFLQRFTSERMAREYLSVYARLSLGLDHSKYYIAS